MKNIDWIEFDNYFLLNYTIVQSLPNNHNFTSSPLQYLQFHNQSSYNLSAHTWCTGLVFTAHGQPLGMIRIDCNLKINASFFCQETLTHSIISSHTLGMPYTFMSNYWTTAECDGGWARVGEYCFLLIKQNKKMSWRENHISCHNQSRASLWNITNISNKYEFVINADNIQDVLTFMTRFTRDITDEKFQRNSAELREMFRLSLADRAINSEFLELEPLRNINKRILSLIGEITGDVRMYVEDCFFVKKHRLHKKGHAIVESSCDQKRNVTHLLCQKGVSKITSSCSPLFYECMGGTCILREYRCDGNYDCHQGDDEQNCKMIQYLSAEKLEYLQDNSWWLFSSVCLHFYPIYETEFTQNCAMIHSLCDNIYDIAIEDTFCKNASTTHHNAHAMSETFEDNLLFTDYFRRMCISGLGSTRYSKKDNSLSVEKCDIIQCPYMFRCDNSYCINIENVCDGQSDCPYQSDEILCENTTCPGMLKCRGEKKCLPDYLLCNNNVDCVYSADDELGCQPCPDKCNCSGYAILCFYPPPQNYSLLFKAVVARYLIKALEYLFWTNNAVLLDLSYCSITYFSNNISLHSILFLNVSNNVLRSLEKKHFQQLHYIHTLDASHNIIDNIFGGKENSAMFKHDRSTLKLITLLLSYNKITVLYKTFFKSLQHLQFFKIEHNPLELVQFTVFNLLINIKFIVSSDASICCLNIDRKTKCSVNSVAIIHERHCIIRTSLYLKILWDILAAGGFVCCVFVAVYQFYRMKRSAYLDIVFINHLLCSILLFVSVLITVHLPTSTYNVDILTTFNWFNAVLKRITILVVVISSLLTIMRDICLTLKTLFPFRHQCRWLKVVPIIPFVTWVLAAICAWVEISLIKQPKLVIVANERRNTFISQYFLILPVLCSNVMLIFMSSFCYKVLLAIKSGALRQHQAGLTQKFNCNVHGNYFCQLILIIGGSCIFIVFSTDFVSTRALHFILPCFYYVFALRAYMTVGGSVWINMFFRIFK